LKAGGTGLGLAISRKFVEIMGGTIDVQSRDGLGTCFRFEVPLENAPGPVRRKTAARHVIGIRDGYEPRRILVVDDKADNRGLLRALLEPVGFEVVQAENGVQALAVLDEQLPDAVLLDMRMPVMDGYEVLRRVRASGKKNDTYLVAVTASAFEDDREEVMAAGVDAYLRKPFQPEELFRLLGDALGLEYEYAEKTESESGDGSLEADIRDTLYTIPPGMREELHQTVSEGDMDRFDTLVDDLENDYPVLSRMLRRLARQYDYDTLEYALGLPEDTDELSE
jgi:CheY-like chemotaxis protein